MTVSPQHRRRVAEETAARFARWRSGEEQAGLEAWLDEDPLRREAWLDLSDAWLGIEPLAAVFETAAKRRRPAYFMVAAQAAAVLMAVGLGVLLWRAFGPNPHRQEIAAAPPAVFQTELGKRSTVVLSDGSLMTLDADSRARVVVEEKVRRVTLERGRAVFSVAKDVSRPFIVSAGSQTVTATGTKFVVNVLSSEVDVGLVEGKVRVERVVYGASGARAARAVDMQRGDWLTAPSAGEWTVSSGDPENMLSWVSGVLVFQNAPLEQVAAEMNRYAAIPIVIADAATGQRRLSAVVAAGDTQTIRDGVLRLGLAHVRVRPDGAIEFYSDIQSGKERANQPT